MTPATDDQIERVRNLSECQVLLPDRREALQAVLSELAASRKLVDTVAELRELLLIAFEGAGEEWIKSASGRAFERDYREAMKGTIYDQQSTCAALAEARK